LSVAISPDGQTLASGSDDKTIKLWNLKTGDLLHTLTGHESYVLSVAISADGQTLASGSADKAIKLWEKQLTPIQITQDALQNKSTPEMPPKDNLCPKCGNPVRPNGLYCRNCGYKLR